MIAATRKISEETMDAYTGFLALHESAEQNIYWKEVIETDSRSTQDLASDLSKEIKVLFRALESRGVYQNLASDNLFSPCDVQMLKRDAGDVLCAARVYLKGDHDLASTLFLAESLHMQICFKTSVTRLDGGLSWTRIIFEEVDSLLRAARKANDDELCLKIMSVLTARELFDMRSFVVMTADIDASWPEATMTRVRTREIRQKIKWVHSLVSSHIGDRSLPKYR